MGLPALRFEQRYKDPARFLWAQTKASARLRFAIEYSRPFGKARPARPFGTKDGRLVGEHGTSNAYAILCPVRNISLAGVLYSYGAGRSQTVRATGHLNSPL